MSVDNNPQILISPKTWRQKRKSSTATILGVILCRMGELIVGRQKKEININEGKKKVVGSESVLELPLLLIVIEVQDLRY